MHSKSLAFDLRPLALALSVALLVVLVAQPALGYVVVLKDGTQITTAKKYELRGERVILTMVNGTETSYRASEVDFERTEEVNEGTNLNQATVIDTVEIEVAAPDQQEEKSSLSDLASRGGLALPEPSQRAPRTGEGAPTAPATEAGFVDLMLTERIPIEDQEVNDAIVTYLSGQGYDGVRVFEGVAENRPFLLMRANSEAQVFESLRDSANALVQINERFPQRVQGFSLLLATDNELRAGQFTLTPETANLLVTGRLEPPAYFVRYVEF